MKVRPDKILLVGGYGHVGKFLARELVTLYPGCVVIAGRRPEAARNLAQALSGDVSYVEINVNDRQSVLRAISEATLVVNCSVDQRKPTLLQAAFESGTDYLDISADLIAIANMLKLSSKAKLRGTHAIIAAGLDPGCTNLLAALAAEHAGGATSVDIALLVSLGDTFGPAALNYILEMLATPVIVDHNGQRQVFEAYRQHRICTFPEPIGRRRAYRFPFPEQAFFAETLHAIHSANWYLMDYPLLNQMFAISASLKLTRMYRWPPVRTFVRRIFPMLTNLHGGGAKNTVCVSAEVQGPNGIWNASLTGRGESRTTALCALPMIQALYERQINTPGVWLPEQVISSNNYMNDLNKLDLHIQVHSMKDRF